MYEKTPEQLVYEEPFDLILLKFLMAYKVCVSPEEMVEALRTVADRLPSLVGDDDGQLNEEKAFSFHT